MSTALYTLMCRTFNVHLVSRTNIEIDDDLIERVMRAYGFKTMREAVDFALRELVEADPKKIRASWQEALSTS